MIPAAGSVARRMQIDIWSDIACPWCYIGKRRLETALADPAMRSSLTCMANSDRKWASKAFGTGSRRLEHLTRD